jgi:ABC-2 type transport system ATP-binding protein
MRAMTQAAIEIVDVHKRFGSRQVLDGITLHIGTGESVALVGLNGAGKTTLLRCLLDFQRPDRGELAIGGISTRKAEARNELAFLAERLLPPAFLTGLEFLQLSARLHQQRWDFAAAKACCGRLALDWSELGKPVRRLSKGTGQKLGLAACLLSGKRVYILDEPLSGLDVQARALALSELLRLREEGCTLLFTCHEPADLDRLCRRVAILHRGQLHFCDTPDALRARYASSDLERAVLACLAQAGTVAQAESSAPT